MVELGGVYEGTINSVMKFGAFVSLDGEQSGLVHISEISDEYVNDINDAVKKGDRVKVKVIKIDDDGRISLSIKQAAKKKETSKTEKAQPQKSARPDSYDWSERRTEEMSFEDKLSKFRLESEEINRDRKRRMENKRSGGYSRKGNYSY